MGLSEAFIDAHIADWSVRLDNAFFPHRKHWPAHLFHHAPLENAVAILREGCLRSRADELNCHPRDVAAAGVIDARNDAHSRVRLYFRPKTPTQFSIEGIRKVGECRYGENTHLPVIVMFCLDATAVLSQKDVQFSNMNMQLGSASVGSTEAEFNAIPFEKVYHEGAIGDDRSIINARCAEVMPASPLMLENCLKAIFLRSSAEKDFLLHALGDYRSQWQSKCYVSDALKVFQKEYAFVEVAELSLDGLIFRLNPRRDRDGVDVSIVLKALNGAEIIDENYRNLPGRPASGGNWLVERKLEQGRYLASIRVEGHLAFEAMLTLEDQLI